MVLNSTKTQQKQGLVLIHNGQNFTTSEIISEGVGYEHKVVMQLIKKYIDDLQEFATLSFKMRPPANGGISRRIALLNEDQATFLMMLMQNNKPVVLFKKKLTKAFSSLIKESNATMPQSFSEALRLAAEQAERLETLEAENQEMIPVVQCHNALVDSSGVMSFSEAAKAICNMGIETGQKRFINWLKDNGYLFKDKNEPYQTYVNQSLFEVKTRKYKHPHTRKDILTTQTYLTAKGVSYFARKMAL